MSIKIFPITLCVYLMYTINMYGAMIDLGIHSNLYEIEEISLKKVLEDKYEKIDKEKLKQNLIDSYSESLRVNFDIKTCNANSKRIYKPIITIEEDIIEPITKTILHKKGTRLNLLKKFNINLKKYILIINADDEVQNLLAYKYANQADIYVAKGSPEFLLNYGIDAQIIPHKSLINTLSINCLPSFYTQNNDEFIINEIDPTKL